MTGWCVGQVLLKCKEIYFPKYLMPCEVSFFMFSIFDFKFVIDRNSAE